MRATPIELARTVVDNEFDSGEMNFRGAAVLTLVESLMDRGTQADLADAQAAVDRLAAAPTETGYVLYELPLLRMRALLARAHGDEVACRDYVVRYREMARACGYEGHLAMANAMT